MLGRLGQPPHDADPELGCPMLDDGVASGADFAVVADLRFYVVVLGVHDKLAPLAKRVAQKGAVPQAVGDEVLQEALGRLRCGSMEQRKCVSDYTWT